MPRSRYRLPEVYDQVEMLVNAGLDSIQIAVRLHLDSSTVRRYRQDLVAKGRLERSVLRRTVDEDMLDSVRLLLEKGASMQDVIESLSISRHSFYKCRRKLIEAGCQAAIQARDEALSTCRIVNDKLLDELRSLLEEGCSVSDVTSLMLIGGTTYYRYRRSLIDSGRVDLSDKGRVKALLRKGVSVNAVAEKLSMSVSTIYKYRRQLEVSGQLDLSDRLSFRSPEGIIHSAKTMTELAQRIGVPKKKLSDVKTGRRNSYKGWTFVSPDLDEEPD